MIRKFVFEDKKLTLSVLYGILENNFAGNELLRRQIDSGIDKFGNDIDEVDIMAIRLYDTYCASVKKLNDQREFPDSRFVMNVFSYNGHISQGERLGATPNGRLRGEPIGDCVGPSQVQTVAVRPRLSIQSEIGSLQRYGVLCSEHELSPSEVKDLAPEPLLF